MTALIIRLAREGVKPAQIAARLGLKRDRVERILRGEA
jgi:hypothetical protein